MTKSYIKDLPQRVGQPVEIEGWVTHFRSSGKIHLLWCGTALERFNAWCPATLSRIGII